MHDFAARHISRLLCTLLLFRLKKDDK